MYHVIHVSEDVHTINDWYERVFDADVWMGRVDPHWSEIEDRHAALLNVSDLCIEPMAPKPPPDDRFPVARFFLRNGSRFHSAGCMVDDIEGFTPPPARPRRLHRAAGRRAHGRGPARHLLLLPVTAIGGWFFAQITRNTDGTYSPNVANDPRLQDDWDVRARRWSEHPLGIERLGYATMAVSDVDATRAVFEKLWLAVPVHDGVDEGRGVRSCFMQLGHFLIEIALPLSDDGPLAEHVARFGDMLYRLHVPRARSRRVEAYSPPSTCAPRHLRRRRLRRPRRLPRRQLRFSTETCPGDPLA